MPPLDDANLYAGAISSASRRFTWAEGRETTPGALDANRTVWCRGAFHRDTWVRPVEGEALPVAPAIVRKKRWLAEREVLLSTRAEPLGLHLDSGERIDDIVADLARFSRSRLISRSSPTAAPFPRLVSCATSTGYRSAATCCRQCAVGSDSRDAPRRVRQFRSHSQADAPRARARTHRRGHPALSVGSK